MNVFLSFSQSPSTYFLLPVAVILGTQAWSDDMQLRSIGEPSRSQSGEHHPTNQFHILTALEVRRSGRGGRVASARQVSENPNMSLTLCYVQAGGAPLHWDSTRDIWKAVRVTSVWKLSSFSSNKVWRLKCFIKNAWHLFWHSDCLLWLWPPHS